MKEFARLIRRYILAAVGIVFLMVCLSFGVLIWIGWRENVRRPIQEYSYGKIADALVETEDGFSFGEEHLPEEWMEGYEWAMILDETGDVVWNYKLPEELQHHYTASEIARFTRWYLEDYPVFTWVEDYGLFVVGMPKESLWKYNFYSSPSMLRDLLRSVFTVVAGTVLLGLALCFWLSFRGAKELQLIARRDNARTQWIAGVSHDVRTPLALILGWAEQLEQDANLPETAREKAGGIRTQSEKLRTLIADLNLTSKLQYGAQPLRKERYTAGPLMRELVAVFCDSPLAEQCDLSLTQTEEAEQVQILADRGLLWRLLENILNNSVRHNLSPVNIQMKVEVKGKYLCLAVTDDGTGYPTEVLAALHGAESGEDAPHILGLHVVEQITSAHGGSITFAQNEPHGAKTIVRLPVA